MSKVNRDGSSTLVIPDAPDERPKERVAAQVVVTTAAPTAWLPGKRVSAMQAAKQQVGTPPVQVLPDEAVIKTFVLKAFGQQTGEARWARLQELQKELGGNASLTVIPISVSIANSGAFDVPLFRVRGDQGERYLDDSGRTYTSFNQWKTDNVLPPGVMTYPVDGEPRPEGPPRTESANTPLTVDTLAERARDLGDTVAMVGGFAVGAAAIFGTGGLATPLVAGAAAVLAGYGAGRSGSALLDRAEHAESLSLANAEARSAWLGLAAGTAGLGALGAAARVGSTLARTGIPASHVSATRAAQSMVVAQAVGDASLVNAGNELWKNRENVTATEVLQTAAQAAMWGGFAVRAGGPTKMYSVRAYRENLLGVRPQKSAPINRKRAAEFEKALATVRKQMVDAKGAYVSPLKPGFNAAVEEGAIAAALKGEKNHWSALHGLSTPELFARAQKVQARINPDNPALASRNTVELYDAIARAVAEQSELGRSLQTRLPPRLKDLYWNYADRMGTPDDATAGSFNDFKPALEHLGTGRGVKHLVSKELWRKFGTAGFVKDVGATLMGRSPLEGAHMPGVAFAPPYESPMLDVGYDSQSHQVRASVGGEKGFKSTVEQLYKPQRLEKMVNSANGRETEAPFLMLDFLGGHVSEQHAQFQAMLNGDKAARKYFNVLPPRTKVIGHETINGAPAAVLETEGGQLSAWLIFGHATQSNFRVDFIPVRDAAEVAKVSPSAVLKLDKVQKQLAAFKKDPKTSDLEALRRWRMDKSWDTRYQYVEVDGALREIVPTYHWFYDFQPSLNHQSTEVQRMMYSFLSEGVNKGVSVFRADAAPHWGFRMPKNGEKVVLTDIDAHQALQENYKLFMMHVAPRAMLIPEVATGIKDASTWYGERIEGPSGRMTNSMADALLDFDSHRALWESVLDERKGPVLEHERDLAALDADPLEKQLLRFQDHHDEMITVTFKNRAAIEKQLKEAGLEDFNGRGVGGRKTDALLGNAKRIAMSELLKRAFPGASFSYYGALEGAKNDPAFMMQMKGLRQRTAAKFGRTVSDQEALDARDLARGNVSRAKLKQARLDGYEPFVLVRALNKLAKARPSIRADSVAEIPNADESVLTLARKSPAQDDSPHLWVMNLSGKPKTITLSLKDLQRELGWKTVSEKSLTDILAKEMTGSARRPKLSVKGDAVELTVEPYGYMILEKR